jgi:hypothetical protein
LAETSSLKWTTSPFSFGLENLPIIIVKGLVLQIEKYLKKRSAANICSTAPIQSAGVSGSGNRFIPRWRPN